MRHWRVICSGSWLIRWGWLHAIEPRVVPRRSSHANIPRRRDWRSRKASRPIAARSRTPCRWNNAVAREGGAPQDARGTGRDPGCTGPRGDRQGRHAARPDAIVHQLTAIPANLNLRRFDREFALTNRLRTEGTDNLLAAARAAGVRRVVAQSFAGWTYERAGGSVKTEEDPLDPDPPPAFRRTLDAIRYLEAALQAAAGIDTVALRYGWFYGPGTSLGRGAALLDAIRRRQLPIVGNGTGIWSFIHIADAAAATVAALQRGAPGIYNVADDEPAPVREWLPFLANAIGAPPPRRVPSWLARILIGHHGVVLMNESRGCSNKKAKVGAGLAPSLCELAHGLHRWPWIVTWILDWRR